MTPLTTSTLYLNEMCSHSFFILDIFEDLEIYSRAKTTQVFKLGRVGFVVCLAFCWVVGFFPPFVLRQGK